MQETRVWSLGREDPLEKEMVTHASTLAWRIPWTEEPGGLQSMGLWKESDMTERLNNNSKMCWRYAQSLGWCIQHRVPAIFAEVTSRERKGETTEGRREESEVPDQALYLHRWEGGSGKKDRLLKVTTEPADTGLIPKPVKHGTLKLQLQLR